MDLHSIVDTFKNVQKMSEAECISFMAIIRAKNIIAEEENPGSEYHSDFEESMLGLAIVAKMFDPTTVDMDYIINTKKLVDEKAEIIAEEMRNNNKTNIC
jgi:hypothetical protein